MPFMRFSQNSHNILSGQAAQESKLDVEDYWAKWLEFKQRNRIKDLYKTADAVSAKSLRSDSQSQSVSYKSKKSNLRKSSSVTGSRNYQNKKKLNSSQS